MSKILLVTLCSLLLTVGTALCDDPSSIKTGVLYQVWFAPDYYQVHSSMSSGNQYVIQIDAVNPSNPNWVLIEFPQAANIAYSTTLAGKRWINLNYVVELRHYVPPPQ
jgi:hypothetical protein